MLDIVLEDTEGQRQGLGRTAVPPSAFTPKIAPVLIGGGIKPGLDQVIPDRDDTTLKELNVVAISGCQRLCFPDREP